VNGREEDLPLAATLESWLLDEANGSRGGFKWHLAATNGGGSGRRCELEGLMTAVAGESEARVCVVVARRGSFLCRCSYNSTGMYLGHPTHHRKWKLLPHIRFATSYQDFR